MSAHGIEHRIDHAALGIAYGRLPASIVFTMLVSAVFGWALLDYYPRARMLEWIGAIQLVAFARLGLMFAWRRRKPGLEAMRTWSWLMAAGAALAALAWSVGAVRLLPDRPSVELAMLCVIVLSTASIALNSLTAHLPSLLAFLVVSLGPFGAALLFSGSPLVQLVGIILLVTMLELLWIGYQSSQGVRQQLRTEIELGMAVEQTRAAQAAAEKAKVAKSRFLATMSHEVRTPLNGMLGLAELLERSPLQPGQREHVRLLRRSGDNLRDILNDVLDFSKIEAEQFEIARLPFDPLELVQDVRDLFQQRAADAGLALTLRTAGGAGRVVLGDRLRTRQVLTNFVSNALKFTERGGIEIELTATPADATPGSVARFRFAVHDSGIGIGPDALARVFDAFTQVDDSYTRRFGGTGLGLAICRRLAGLMGGEVGASSTPGAGSTFWVELPLEVVSVSAALDGVATQALLEQAATSGAANGDHGGDALQGRVLVAEDNGINQLVISEMLTLIGVEYVLVGNGQEAVDAALSGEFDLVLMDCQMPVMDGYTATLELRRRAPLARSGQPLPIVALTANAFDDDRARAAEVGMDAFLSKPVRLDDLRAMLARWLPPVAGLSEPAAAKAARCT